MFKLEKKLEILKKNFIYSHSSGDEHLFFCVHCNHKSPKMSVNLKKGVYKCWVCQEKRSIFHLGKYMKNCENEWEWSDLFGDEKCLVFDAKLAERMLENELENGSA